MKQLHQPLKLILLCIGLLALQACAYYEKTEFVIIQLNDVYELDGVESGSYGGFARVQSLITEMEGKYPEVLTVLSGDLFSPSALGNALDGKGQRFAGKQMVEMLNYMNWDYFTFGNHEFDLDSLEFYNTMEVVDFEVITDNVLDTSGELFPNTKDHQTFVIGDYKVGIFGLTMQKVSGKYTLISPPLEVGKRVTSALKNAGADFIIGITHQSVEDDEALARNAPDIDLILGGHEHENYYLTRGENLTPIAKADGNAKSAYVHYVSFDAKGTPTVRSELRVLDSKVSKDSATEAYAQMLKNKAFQAFIDNNKIDPTEKVARPTETLIGKEYLVRSQSTNLTDLITRSFINAFDDGVAQASLLNGGSIRLDDNFLKDSLLTRYDVMKISPFANTAIYLVDMPGNLLNRALTIGKDQVGVGSFLHYGRIREGETGFEIHVGGKWGPIDSNTTYKIVLPTYMIDYGDTGLEFLAKNDSIKKLDKKDFMDTVADQLTATYPVK